MVWSVKILVDKKDLSMGDIGATLSIPGIFVILNDQVRSNAILIGTRGCQRCSFVLQSAFNCLNLKWQLVEHVG